MTCLAPSIVLSLLEEKRDFSMTPNIFARVVIFWVHHVYEQIDSSFTKAVWKLDLICVIRKSRVARLNATFGF